VTYVKESKECDAYPKSCELYDTENKKMDKCPSKFDYNELLYIKNEVNKCNL